MQTSPRSKSTMPPPPSNGNGQSSLAADIAALYAALDALDLPHPDGKGPCPPPRLCRLSFGRYKGLPLSQIPLDYLMWVLREVKWSSDLRAAVSEELACRDRSPPLPPDTRLPNCPCIRSVREEVRDASI